MQSAPASLSCAVTLSIPVNGTVTNADDRHPAPGDSRDYHLDGSNARRYS